MSAPDERRAAHIAAFAMLVKDQLVTSHQAINSLLRRDYFTIIAAERTAARPAGHVTARGMAWLVAGGQVAYSEGAYLVALSVRGKSKDVRIEHAMERGERLLAQALTRLEERRSLVGAELHAAVDRIEGKPGQNKAALAAPGAMQPRAVP